MSRFLSLLCLSFAVVVAAGQETKLDLKSLEAVAGTWEGAIKPGALELRFGITLKTNDKNGLSGELISIDQGGAKIPITKGSVTNGEYKIQIPSVGASFAGKLNDKGDLWTGTFYQGPAKFPLELKKVKELTRLKRPQEPKPPFPYICEEVSYENAKAKVKLSGTLTLPKDAGPHPVVLLITGSGPQDRDETLLGHKPFLVIADYLTRRGVAVLRVDDRGVGKSTGDFAKATSFDFAEDALAGVEYLKTRKDIDHKRIGLAGHSEGGLIAPIVATKSKDVAFIILLAGTGLTGEDIIYLQSRLIAKAMGARTEMLDRSEAIQRKAFALLKAEEPSPELTKKIKALFAEEMAKLPDALKKEAEKEGNLEAAQAQIGALTTPWFKVFLFHDPRPVLAQVKCPVLALNGELDLQVPCKENLDAIRKALEDAGHKQHTIKAFPKLNHLFQTCTTGAPTEYGKIEETFSPDVLKTMGDWIQGLSTR